MEALRYTYTQTSIRCSRNDLLTFFDKIVLGAICAKVRARGLARAIYFWDGWRRVIKTMIGGKLLKKGILDYGYVLQNCLDGILEG